MSINFENRSRSFYIGFLVMIVVAIMLLFSGLQFLLHRNQQVAIKAKQDSSLIQTDSNGQPTKQAFMTQLSEQAAAKQQPYVKPDPALVTKIEKIKTNWYILTLNIESADSSTTLALFEFSNPDTLKLYAGPGGYFHQDWLTDDGVPADIAANLVARNEEENE